MNSVPNQSARSLPATVLLVLVAVWLAGCGDNPVSNQEVCDHIDADGLVIEQAGVLVAHQWEGDVFGSLTLTMEATAEFAVTFLGPDSTRIHVPGACTDHWLGWVIADTSIVQATAVPGEPWRVSLLGHAPGETTLRLRIIHGEHADFTSQPFTVQVLSPLAVMPEALFVSDKGTQIASWNYDPVRGPDTATGVLLALTDETRSGLQVVWLGPWQEGDGSHDGSGRVAADLPADVVSLGWEVADPTLARLEPVTGEPWRFDLVPLAAGHTTLILRLLAGATPLWSSGALDLVVADPAEVQDPAPDLVLNRSGAWTVIIIDGEPVAAGCGRTTNPGWLEGRPGESTDLFRFRLLDDECSQVTPPGLYLLTFMVADAGVAHITNHPLHWGEHTVFHVDGEAVGETTLQLFLLRRDSWRLQLYTPPLPLIVTAG